MKMSNKMKGILHSICLLPIILFSISVSPQASSGQSKTEVRQAIESGNAEYIKAFAETNAAALATVYDINGARLSSNGKATKGREAITSEISRFFDEIGPVKVTIETIDLWVIDDLAYETGKWSYTFTPKGKELRTIGGRYVTVWKKQSDRDWKILADIGVPGT